MDINKKIDELIDKYEFNLGIAKTSSFPHIDIYIRLYEAFLKDLKELKEKP